MFSWDLIRSFLALTRAGTFEGAAQLLNVDHSTLRRRIQSLEQQFGRSLFTRCNGSYVLLPDNAALLEAATAMEALSRRFAEADLHEAPAGKLRVTTIDVFAELLAPAYAEFLSQHPGITLDVTTEDRFVDLEREQVDIAIRLARPVRGKGRLRKLADVRFSVFATPAYLERRAAAANPAGDDLLVLGVHFLHRDHDCLAADTDWMLQHLPGGRVVCTTDSYLALRRFCEAGIGLALLPDILGEKSASLVRLHAVPAATCDLWLVVHAESGATRRATLFIDFLVRTFKLNETFRQ
jgi:DNA-binding transcriptional LysR family regulator